MPEFRRTKPGCQCPRGLHEPERSRGVVAAPGMVVGRTADLDRADAGDPPTGVKGGTWGQWPRAPSLPNTGFSTCPTLMFRSASPLAGNTINRRAGCGRSARPVRREGGANPIASPYPYHRWYGSRPAPGWSRRTTSSRLRKVGETANRRSRGSGSRMPDRLSRHAWISAGAQHRRGVSCTRRRRSDLPRPAIAAA